MPWGGRTPYVREHGRGFFEAVEAGTGLVTSAEVLQEMLHAYLGVGRHATLDAAFTLVAGCVDEVWSVDAEDLHLARALDGAIPVSPRAISFTWRAADGEG